MQLIIFKKIHRCLLRKKLLIEQYKDLPERSFFDRRYKKYHKVKMDKRIAELDIKVSAYEELLTELN